MTKIALIGGTGKEGYGLALQWNLAGHDIIIGSRRDEKAKSSAEKVRDATKQKNVKGLDNLRAAQEGEIIVLTIPFFAVDSTLEQIRKYLKGKIVITPVVPMSYNKETKHASYEPPPEGSAAEYIQKLIPKARLVSAIHNISHGILEEAEHIIENDVLVCGDDQDAKQIVAELIKQIKGLNFIDAGPLENSSVVEAITPMLLDIARRNPIRHTGIKITGRPPQPEK